MATGQVKWYDATKGFGFITPDDGSADVFLHHSILDAARLTTIADGQAVSYDIEESPRGLRVKVFSLAKR